MQQYPGYATGGLPPQGLGNPALPGNPSPPLQNPMRPNMQPQPMHQAAAFQVSKLTESDINQIQILVERCIQLYMTKQEAMHILAQQPFNIPPHLTDLIWLRLEASQKDFFEAYNLRLRLKHQIKQFNNVVKAQSFMTKQLAQQIQHTQASSSFQSSLLGPAAEVLRPATYEQLKAVRPMIPVGFDPNTTFLTAQPMVLSPDRSSPVPQGPTVPAPAESATPPGQASPEAQPPTEAKAQVESFDSDNFLNLS